MVEKAKKKIIANKEAIVLSYKIVLNTGLAIMVGVILMLLQSMDNRGEENQRVIQKLIIKDHSLSSTDLALQKEIDHHKIDTKREFLIIERNHTKLCKRVSDVEKEQLKSRYNK